MTATGDFYMVKITGFFSGAFLVVLLMSGTAWSGIVEEVDRGDKAVIQKNMDTAEEAYENALKLDPDHYRVLAALAKVKVALGKYEQAEELVNRVLAMKINNGKMVQVYLDGAAEGLDAEIVDENVLAGNSGKNNMRNYLDLKDKGVEPHYRFFFLKEGKMELVPRSRARVKYVGVPRRVHEEMTELLGKVRMRLIESSESKGPQQVVRLEGGCFSMGSEHGAQSETPVHKVCLTPFEIDKFEVSQQAFQLMMGTNPSRFKSADLPVESVTWWEADQYCRKVGKRLPTEAEWEYAMRGGTTTEYYWGDEFDPGKANFCDGECTAHYRLKGTSDGYKSTAPGGKYPANAFGLHDMAGNVSEWVSDWFEETYYRISEEKDPQGAVRDEARLASGGQNYKTFRGGGWESRGQELRSSARKGLWADYRVDAIGFRCARN